MYEEGNSSASKRARTSSYRKIGQMSNSHKSIDGSDKNSNKSLHSRQSSNNPSMNVSMLHGHVNLQYLHKLADPLKIKNRDS